MFQYRSGSEINKIFLVAWAIWNNRSNVAWKQGGKECNEIVVSAVQDLNNWEFAQDKSFDYSFGFVTQTEGNTCWEQPRVGSVKVNVDAALFESSNLFSYAMVARDHNRLLLKAKSSCKQESANPELAEAIGIREALSWVKEQEWLATIVESDCLIAVQTIRCSSFNFSYLGRVIDECKNLLVELESKSVALKFVKRFANKVAHYLARYSSY